MVELNANDWLAGRKEILSKIKTQVSLYLGPDSDDLEQYKNSYRNDIYSPWTASDKTELKSAIAGAQVIFGGDFHAHAQAQRAHMRILRELPEGRKFRLGLECLRVSDQPWVDEYLAGQIDEAEFLEKIDWNDAWGFPWENYKPLFYIAKTRGGKIFGLSPKGSSNWLMEKRDKVAAEIINNNVEANSDLIYVVYGDLHIAKDRLPKYFTELAGNISILSIYLNPEHVYFDLAQKGQEGNVDVIRYDSRRFALLVSPPWVKWQSYLMYLEKCYDFDIDEDEDFVDYTDHIASLVQFFSNDLGVECSLDEISVYTSGDPFFWEQNLTKEPQDKKVIRSLVESDRSFYLSSTGIFYLSRSSVNHAATLAGHYFHDQLAQVKSNMLTMPRDFLPNIWAEAIAFFLSKLINPKRKAPHVSDLKKQLEAFSPGDSAREALLLALNQKMGELLEVYGGRDEGSNFVPENVFSYFRAAQFLGEMLGERIFKVFSVKVLLSSELIEWISFNMDRQDFVSFYFSVLKRLDKLEDELKDVR